MAAVLLCSIGALVSAFASSVGIMGSPAVSAVVPAVVWLVLVVPGCG